MDYYSIVGKFARMLPAEMAHEAALCALKHSMLPQAVRVEHPALVTECFGLTFLNPVGMAPGIDNDAEAVNAIMAQGFGFMEAGGVTPLPQPGNPKPRLFRLSEYEAVINRKGFPNLGVLPFVENMKKRSVPGVIGVNIAKNKDSLDYARDYVSCMEAVYDHVDYITVNVSSPNTAGLRDLQKKEALSALMQELEKKRGKLAQASQKRKPVLYKIAPDLTPQDKEDIVEVALAHNVDGLVVTNTTVSRPEHVKSVYAKEGGGLSGKPLFALSTAVLRDIYCLSQGKIPLIGVGGIASAEDAYTKIKSGASLVQFYTALVYQGFGLVGKINRGLIELLARDGFKNVKDAVGVEVK